MHSVNKAAKNFTRFAGLLFMLAFVFLMTTRTSAASNMIKYADNKQTPSGKFQVSSKGVRYKYDSGSYAKNTWHKVNKYYFSFDRNGYTRTGWFTYEGKVYYASTKGAVYHGMWHNEGSKQYFLKADGTLAKNQWVVVGEAVYRVDSNGVLIKKKMYKVGDTWYFAKANGMRVANAWVNSGGNRFYFGKDAARVQNKWVKYKGKYYYLKSNGVMARNEIVGKYRVGEDGAMTGTAVKHIFVGDSRTVGMQSAVSDQDAVFIAKVGAGYDWLKSTAEKTLLSYLRNDPTVKIVFCFGVNDFYNIDRYISYYRTLIAQWPKAKIHIASVNPIDEKIIYRYYRSTSATNKAIREFNKKLYAAFKSRYINSFYWMCLNGYETTDGLHYTTDTSRRIYNYMKSQI